MVVDQTLERKNAQHAIDRNSEAYPEAQAGPRMQVEICTFCVRYGYRHKQKLHRYLRPASGIYLLTVQPCALFRDMFFQHVARLGTNLRTKPCKRRTTRSVSPPRWCDVHLTRKDSVSRRS